MPEEHCEKQSELAQAVVNAVTKVYEATRALQDAKEKKLYTLTLGASLSSARAEERGAVVALDEHKKEHGCEA